MQLICLIFAKVLIKIKINSIDTLSKLLTCVLLYLGEAAVDEFFIQDLHLNFHFF